jgi:hypothetical protein
MSCFVRGQWYLLQRIFAPNKGTDLEVTIIDVHPKDRFRGGPYESSEAAKAAAEGVAKEFRTSVRQLEIWQCPTYWNGNSFAGMASG